MVERGYLESDNKRRWANYHIKGEKVATSNQKVATSKTKKVATSEQKVATSDQKVDTSDQKVATSDQKVDTSDQKVATSDQKVDTSDQKVDTSKTKKVDTSDQKVDTSDQKVDTSNLTKRISKGGLEFLIMDICNEKYVKMEVIAEQVGRSLDYLKNKIFPNMVKQGKLEKKYPLNPNHPEQAYKTTEIYTKKNY